MPILLITGYTGTVEQAVDLPQLAKPFIQADLGAAIARLGIGDTVAALRQRASARP